MDKHGDGDMFDLAEIVGDGNKRELSEASQKSLENLYAAKKGAGSAKKTNKGAAAAKETSTPGEKEDTGERDHQEKSGSSSNIKNVNVGTTSTGGGEDVEDHGQHLQNRSQEHSAGSSGIAAGGASTSSSSSVSALAGTGAATVGMLLMGGGLQEAEAGVFLQEDKQELPTDMRTGEDVFHGAEKEDEANIMPDGGPAGPRRAEEDEEDGAGEEILPPEPAPIERERKIMEEERVVEAILDGLWDDTKSENLTQKLLAVSTTRTRKPTPRKGVEKGNAPVEKMDGVEKGNAVEEVQPPGDIGDVVDVVEEDINNVDEEDEDDILEGFFDEEDDLLCDDDELSSKKGGAAVASARAAALPTDEDCSQPQVVAEFGSLEVLADTVSLKNDKARRREVALKLRTAPSTQQPIILLSDSEQENAPTRTSSCSAAGASSSLGAARKTSGAAGAKGAPALPPSLFGEMDHVEPLKDRDQQDDVLMDGMGDKELQLTDDDSMGDHDLADANEEEVHGLHAMSTTSGAPAVRTTFSAAAGAVVEDHTSNKSKAPVKTSSVFDAILEHDRRKEEEKREKKRIAGRAAAAKRKARLQQRAEQEAGAGPAPVGAARGEQKSAKDIISGLLEEDDNELHQLSVVKRGAAAPGKRGRGGAKKNPKEDEHAPPKKKLRRADRGGAACKGTG